MTKVHKRKAAEVEVEPAYVEGMEEHGLCYFIWSDNHAVGAQCSNCHSIIWLDSRVNQILNEQRPCYVPESGEGHRIYYREKLSRFLESLPCCPSCGKNSYDKFINNTSYPRYSDGTEFDDFGGNIKLIHQDPNAINIWWLVQ